MGNLGFVLYVTVHVVNPIQGRSKGRAQGARAPKAPSNFFYKHNTTLSCTMLQVYGHCGNVPFKRLASQTLWTISLALQPTDCVLYFKTKMAGNRKR